MRLALCVRTDWLRYVHGSTSLISSRIDNTALDIPQQISAIMQQLFLLHPSRPTLLHEEPLDRDDEQGQRHGGGKVDRDLPDTSASPGWLFQLAKVS